MDLIPKKPTQQQPSTGRSSSDGAGRGMEFAIVVLAFLGLGYVLDRALGTKPVFMIVLVVLSLIGQFASMWYGYDARMRELEAERDANARVRKDVTT
jgi:F0F1-type ATP synthase assembly protein I